ncbi:MAG: peptide deformylase [Candidatus Dojkabacteria bacterium]|nr:peptide deformylase [Candidatus Dojkabacteria bacterium]MDQ7021456.1 peptide deformylase [Candidatus Dojkabacteria bacterium]
MISEIAEIGNSVLREKSLEITNLNDPVIKELDKSLKDTLFYTLYGIGLAAPQIFQNKRAFVIALRKTPTRPDTEAFGPVVMLNPEIVSETGAKKKMMEGCLSIGNIYGEVERRSKVKVKWYDTEGKENTEEFTGLLGRVIQHEYDHLEGILFTDLADPKSLMSEREYRLMIEKKKAPKKD